MVLNSFLGRRDIVLSILASPKSKFLASDLDRAILRLFGAGIIRIFGWPLWLEARIVARTVLEFVGKGSGRLLDVGGSYGPLSFELARLGWNVTVVDVDADNLALGEQIRRILREENVTFQSGDILTAGFADGQFDVVLGSEVIEHIKDDELATAEMTRILKANGLMVLATPFSACIEEYSSPRLALSRDVEGVPLSAFSGGGHWRNGYNEGRIGELLVKCGVAPARFGYVFVPPAAPPAALFPLSYAYSLLAPRKAKRCVGIVVKARKHLGR